MKTILHPDYWVEIPAGEFLTGLSDEQRGLVRSRIHAAFRYDRFSAEEHQLVESIIAKIRWARAHHQLTELNDAEIALNHLEPFSSIVDWELKLASVPPQRAVWLDRFYMARFPVTEKQYGTFQEGTPAADLPGALEEPVLGTLHDPRPEAMQLIRSTLGHTSYPTRRVAQVGCDLSLRLCQALAARLPRDLEWEKAARGTDGRLYPWGNEWDPGAGYFYRSMTSSPREDWVDAFPRGVSPYGVWSMAGCLPELVIFDRLRPHIGIRGCHPKESWEGTAWFDHMLVWLGGTRSWVSLRLVLDTWPRRQWAGFQAEEVDEAHQPRPVELPALPAGIPSSRRPLITAGNAGSIAPLSELTLGESSRIGGGDWIMDLAWSPDSRWIAVADMQKTELYHVGLLEPHMLADSIDAVAFNSDSTILASFGADYKSLRRLNLKTGANLAPLKIPKQFTRGLDFSPDGSTLASCDTSELIKLWDAVTGSEVSVLRGHSEGVGRVVFSPDGKLLASASVDATVRLWEVESGAEVAVLTQHTQPVYDVAFNPDGTVLASASADGTARLWNVEDFTERQVLGDPGRNLAVGVSFSPDGKLLAVGYTNGMFKIWSAVTGKVVTTVQCEMGWNIRAVFSPSGTLLATTSRTMVLWGIPAPSTAMGPFGRA